jgi:hypothetical protein
MTTERIEVATLCSGPHASARFQSVLCSCGVRFEQLVRVEPLSLFELEGPIDAIGIVRPRQQPADEGMPEMKGLVLRMDRSGWSEMAAAQRAPQTAASSTPVAFSENSEKFTPPACGVAPSVLNR